MTIRPDMIGPRPLRPANTQTGMNIVAERNPLSGVVWPGVTTGQVNGVMPGCHVPKPEQPALIIRDDLMNKAGARAVRSSIKAHAESHGLVSKALISEMMSKATQVAFPGMDKPKGPPPGMMSPKTSTVVGARPPKRGRGDRPTMELKIPGETMHTVVSQKLKGMISKAKGDEWISNKIKILMNEGKPQDQAIAIAYSMAGRSQDKAKKSDPGLYVAG